jgi:MFS family permease
MFLNKDMLGMKLGILTKGIQISPKKFLAVVFLLSGTFAWFLLIFSWFDTLFNKMSPDLVFLANALFFTSAGLSAILALALSQKISRRTLLGSWIIFGVLTTLSLIFMQQPFFAVPASVMLGIALGLGFPASLAFLAEATVPEERARIAGSVFFIAFVLVVVSQTILTLLGNGIITAIIFCAALRLSSLLVLSLDSCKVEKAVGKIKKSVGKQKNFILYTIPWLIFNLANGLAAFVTLGFFSDPTYTAALDTGLPVHFFAAGLFALIGGIAADRFGRRQPVMLGLVILGISFALLGVFTSPATLLIYEVVSGMAWGFLMVIYTAIPGDLSRVDNRQSYYAIATVIPLLMYMSLTTISNFLGISVEAFLLSSLLSTILFISVIPILRASESLSEEKIRERQLKEHMEKIEELMKEANET